MSNGDRDSHYDQDTGADRTPLPVEIPMRHRPLFNGTEPWWYRFLERLGLPTFLLLVLLYFGSDFLEDFRTDLSKGFTDITNEQKRTNNKLDDLIRDHR